MEALSLFGRVVPLVLSMLLLGCGGELSPTPDVPATETAVAVRALATLTLQAPAPTPTPTPEPTSTPEPRATLTPEPTPTPGPQIPDYGSFDAEYDEVDGRYEAPVPGRDFAMAYWNSETNSWVAIEMRGGTPPSPDHINVYLSADAQESPGTLVPNQRFILTGDRQGGRLEIEDVVSGNEFWVDADSAFGPAEEFQIPPPPPAETPRPPEGQPVFCPAIPEGFYRHFAEPPEDFVQEVPPSRLRPHYFRFAIYGEFIGGVINSDGSFIAEIEFNYQGVGVVRARYYVPANIFKGLMINGESGTINAGQISPEQICLGDTVFITSSTSAEDLNPNVPPTDPERGKELTGPYYVLRFRQR